MVVQVDGEQLRLHGADRTRDRGAYAARMGAAPSELELALADAGGVGAPREYGARLRELLASELGRGASELGQARSGREQPIAVGVAARSDALLAALPLDPRMRADPAAGARSRLRAGGGGRRRARRGVRARRARLRAPTSALLMGDGGGFLVLAYPADDEGWRVEFAREALDEACRRIDRLRARTLALPEPRARTGRPARANRGDAPAAGSPRRSAGSAARRSTSDSAESARGSGPRGARAARRDRPRARRPGPTPARDAPHPSAARRDGQVGRLPHRLRPRRARLRRQRAPARERGGRGARGRRPARHQAERRPAPRLPQPAQGGRHPPPDRHRRAALRSCREARPRSSSPTRSAAASAARSRRSRSRSS